MKTDAVYARQSVEKKDSLSIAGQIDLCHRTADGGELRVYKDAGYSGKNTERPAFQQLMLLVQIFPHSDQPQISLLMYSNLMVCIL